MQLTQSDIAACIAAVQPQFGEFIESSPNTSQCNHQETSAVLAHVVYRLKIGNQAVDNRIIRSINSRDCILALKPVTEIDIGTAFGTERTCQGVGRLAASWA
jgi:hypothetical protein